MAPSPCPRRCFLADVSTTVSKDPVVTLLRLMGVVVSIVQESLQEPRVIVLDDGTGVTAITTPGSMLDSARCCGVGVCLDVIVRVERDSYTLSTDQQQQQLKLKAETIIVVTDAHAETLRWLELAYRKQEGVSYLKSRTGYPCGTVGQDNVYELIESEAEQGVSVQDLAIVLDLPTEDVQDIIQEFQIQGLVYQNKDGCFLPL